MDTYCAAAFTQIYADNASRYRLCCHANVNPDIIKYNTNNCNPFEYFLSDEMEQIRDDMLSGKKIAGCEECYKIEERGHKSWRQWKYNTIYDLRSDVHKVNLKLRIMGSYCNLGCYMCYPYNSSTRRVELNKNDIDWSKYDEGFVSTSTKRYTETVQDILNNIALVERMNITGGEPLQLDRMWQLMEKIPDEHAQNITLTFDTNLTKLEYKNWNIWQLIDKFKAVELGVSCDHYGDKLAWIRYPIDVHKFEKNLYTMKEYISNINVTVSMLNILDLDEIEMYYKDFNTTFYGIVSAPEMLSIKNIFNKEELIKKYKRFPMVVQELQKNSIDGFYEKGLDYCRKLNSQRNIDFNQLFKSSTKFIGDSA